jgi:hypothetical protein
LRSGFIQARRRVAQHAGTIGGDQHGVDQICPSAQQPPWIRRQ